MMVSKKMHQKKRFVSLPTQGKEGHLQYSYYCNTVSLTHTYTHTEREREREKEKERAQKTATNH